MHVSWTWVHNGIGFMECFIKESLRSWGASFLERTCTKSYYIPELNLTIPEGSLVQMAGGSIMNDEKFYANPKTFDPEGHFNTKNLSPATFFSFGQGTVGPNCLKNLLFKMFKF